MSNCGGNCKVLPVASVQLLSVSIPMAVPTCWDCSEYDWMRPAWMLLGAYETILTLNKCQCQLISLSIYCHLATTQVEAKLCAVEEDTFEVYLYVTIKNEKSK